jgi:hypothetical protein
MKNFITSVVGGTRFEADPKAYMVTITTDEGSLVVDGWDFWRYVGECLKHSEMVCLEGKHPYEWLQIGNASLPVWPPAANG